MLLAPPLAALVLAAVPPQVPTDEALAADRAELLAGVETLEQVGLPGPVVVFGPAAFAVLTSADGQAVVAAARYGAGRVVAFGHSGYLAEAPPDSGRGRLLTNAFRWAAGGDEGAATADARSGDLSGARVVRWAGGDLPAERQQELLVFVRAGGGLVVGECPWGWQQLHPGASLRDDAPANRVLAPMGLVFGPTTLGGPYPVASSRPDLAHAARALERLRAADGLPAGPAEAARVLERAISALPAEDEILLPALDAFFRSRPGFEPPSEQRPLASEDLLSRLQVLFWTRVWAEAPAAEVPAAPGAEAFPGPVPETAPRVARMVVASRLEPGWISTGLYAPAGEPVTVRARRGRLDGWRLRIGPHSDSLVGLTVWKRWPEISRVFALAGEETVLASPFGGLIYLEAGAGAEAPVHLEVAGAVEAPFFDLRRPGAEESWAEVRRRPAPWAEIAGKHLILTLPSAAIRDLEEPARLARFWDRVVEAHCWLGARPLPARPERFVADVQISAGYMHSGYPIMTWLDVTRPAAGRRLGLVVDVERLEREGSWGHFHELGHNRQRPEWTFAGTGEVTCNLFSLHAGDVVCGIDPWENPWLLGQKKKVAPYLAEGADFARWRRDPGLALVFYAQVVHEFGWEPFRRVFAEYEALPAAERPRTDEEKRDQWLVRLSRATGRNLGPFFRRWGIPVGREAQDEVDDLPRWMPDWREVGVAPR
ncbi:MAG: hypothetical protein D6702_07720 [Planctomycetota bacterium]|nr:MAG: hypothetical protein D6702_07720 [Planctomycetota bacterium]